MAARNVNNPDYLLAEENFPELNRSFYEASPHDYLYERLQNLVLVAGRAEDLDRLVSEGISFGGLHLGGGPETNPDSPEQRRRKREQYIVTEAEVLMHHASEALLRLFFAHAPSAKPNEQLTVPACPWLEVASLRNFAEFKRRVQDRFLATSDELKRRVEISTVFYGFDSPGYFQPTPPQDRWQEGIDNIARFLEHYARYFLDNANLYNAAKHGLAVMPGELAIRWNDGSVISASGPSIDYLEVAEREGQLRWHRTTAWVQIDQTMAFIGMACLLIEALWSIARRRYLGGQGMQVRLFDTPPYKDLVAGPSIRTTHIQMELLYYAPPT